MQTSGLRVQGDKKQVLHKNADRTRKELFSKLVEDESIALLLQKYWSTFKLTIEGQLQREEFIGVRLCIAKVTDPMFHRRRMRQAVVDDYTRAYTTVKRQPGLSRAAWEHNLLSVMVAYLGSEWDKNVVRELLGVVYECITVNNEYHKVGMDDVEGTAVLSYISLNLCPTYTQCRDRLPFRSGERERVPHMELKEAREPSSQAPPEQRGRRGRSLVRRIQNRRGGADSGDTAANDNPDRTMEGENQEASSSQRPPTVGSVGGSLSRSGSAERSSSSGGMDASQGMLERAVGGESILAKLRRETEQRTQVRRKTAERRNISVLVQHNVFQNYSKAESNQNVLVDLEGSVRNLSDVSYRHINSDKYNPAELVMMLGSRTATFSFGSSASGSRNSREHSVSYSRDHSRSRKSSLSSSYDPGFVRRGSTEQGFVRRNSSDQQHAASMWRRRRSSSTVRRRGSSSIGGEVHGATRRMSASSSNGSSKRSSLSGKPGVAPGHRRDSSTDLQSGSYHNRVLSFGSMPGKGSITSVASNGDPGGDAFVGGMMTGDDDEGLSFPIGVGSIELQPGDMLPCAYVPTDLLYRDDDSVAQRDSSSEIRVPVTNILAKKLAESQTARNKPPHAEFHIEPNEEIQELVDKYEPVFQTLHQVHTDKTQLDEVQELLAAYRKQENVRRMRKLYDYNYVGAFLDNVYVNMRPPSATAARHLDEIEKTAEEKENNADDTSGAASTDETFRSDDELRGNAREAATIFDPVAQDRARDVAYFMNVQSDGVVGLNFLLDTVC